MSDTALDAFPGLPVLEELDTTPTLEELNIAIGCGKALGKDGIPPRSSETWEGSHLSVAV